MRILVWVVVVSGLAGCFTATDESSTAALDQGSTAQSGSCQSVTLVNPGGSVQESSPCICTRRDAVPAGHCARGLDESVSDLIGPAGGTLTLKGQQGTGVPFSITFPPGSLTSPTQITVTETSILPPSTSVDWSPIYRVEPVGLTLAVPASLRVPWGQGGQQGSSGLPLLFWSSSSLCTLAKVPDSYTNAGFDQGSITQLGYGMVGVADRGFAPACH